MHHTISSPPPHPIILRWTLNHHLGPFLKLDFMVWAFILYLVGICFWINIFTPTPFSHYSNDPNPYKKGVVPTFEESYSYIKRNSFQTGRNRDGPILAFCEAKINSVSNSWSQNKHKLYKPIPSIISGAIRNVFHSC